MAAYELTWITPQLAVGYAPMSYDDLESIREQGINAIVNLCGEFCDLHEIEDKFGFDVYYLPVPDEWVPDMEALEKALSWVDEAIYLGKKVLVHCRHGIGRTGTFVASYLLRKGLALKVAEKKLKGTRATPTNYYQWKLLRKFQKRSPPLKIREPVLEARNIVDLAPFFGDYESLVNELEDKVKEAIGREERRCGNEDISCCAQPFKVPFIEAVYLTKKMNVELKAEVRKEVLSRSWSVSRDSSAQFVCPINVEETCSLYPFRPVRCRVFGISLDKAYEDKVEKTIDRVSMECFFAFSGMFPPKKSFEFWIEDVVSGRFVQDYFRLMFQALKK